MTNRLETKNFEPTIYEYPQGYFDIQYAFAQRVVALDSTATIPNTLRDATSIHRRICGKKGTTPENWDEVCASPQSVWQAYIANPKHRFEPPALINDGCHQGSYICKPYPNDDFIVDKATGLLKVELHFLNHRGVKGEYSRQNIGQMTHDLGELFRNVAQRMKANPLFNPQFVTLGSWMNNFKGIQDSLPPEFVASAKVVRPPNLSFKGDSIWGQFLNSDGGINPLNANKFLEALPRCRNLDDLVDAFPQKVILFRSPIKPFFDFYNINL